MDPSSRCPGRVGAHYMAREKQQQVLPGECEGNWRGSHGSWLKVERHLPPPKLLVC